MPPGTLLIWGVTEMSKSGYYLSPTNFRGSSSAGFKHPGRMTPGAASPPPPPREAEHETVPRQTLKEEILGKEREIASLVS